MSLGTSFTTLQDRPSVTNVDRIMGAYIPDTLHLEKMEGTNQTRAILEFLQKGFDEYYFVMDNFWDAKEIDSTERLLNAGRQYGIKNSYHSFTSLRRRSYEEL